MRAVIAAVLVVAVVGCQKIGLSDGRTAKSEADVREQVMRHPWWKKMDRATLDRALDYIVDTESSWDVAITEVGDIARVRWVSDRHAGAYYSKGNFMYDPEAPFIVIPPNKDARPTRAMVLDEMAATLDRAEYRDGSAAKRAAKGK